MVEAVGISFERLRSNEALVTHREHRTDCGVGTVWSVLLGDGYLIDCGTQGKARAHILAEIINEAGCDRLGKEALKSWTEK